MEVISAIFEASRKIGEEAFRTRYSMSARQMITSKQFMKALEEEYNKLNLGNKVEQFDIAFHNAK